MQQRPMISTAEVRSLYHRIEDLKVLQHDLKNRLANLTVEQKQDKRAIFAALEQVSNTMTSYMNVVQQPNQPKGVLLSLKVEFDATNKSYQENILKKPAAVEQKPVQEVKPATAEKGRGIVGQVQAILAEQTNKLNKFMELTSQPYDDLEARKNMRGEIERIAKVSDFIEQKIGEYGKHSSKGEGLKVQLDALKEVRENMNQIHKMVANKPDAPKKELQEDQSSRRTRRP